jgi:hypothetical protein
MLFDFKRW